MLPNIDPFTILVDLSRGTLDPRGSGGSDGPAGQLVERRVGDMAGMYEAGDAAPADRLVYRVRPVPVPEDYANIFCSTTIVQPGTVGREYHMTKGHFHEMRDRGEFYLGLSGEGRLLLATEDGSSRVEPLRPGTLNYIPGGWAHRSVNVSGDELVFLSAFVADAGHDYATIETEGFPVLVVEGGDGPDIITNPNYGG